MSLKVLAVDDSLTIRELLKRCLLDAGFDVDVAVDGMDGLEKLELAKPDVVITDINMPRMDGFEFIDALRGGVEPTSVPILVLTTESATDLKQRARDAGASGWIVKPFDETKLVTAIRRVTDCAA